MVFIPSLQPGTQRPLRWGRSWLDAQGRLTYRWPMVVGRHPMLASEPLTRITSLVRARETAPLPFRASLG